MSRWNINHAQRKRDVHDALDQLQGFRWLATRWGITPPGAYYYCLRNHPDDIARLGENGRMRCGNPHVPVFDRLSLVAFGRANGWTDQRIASALNISGSALCVWLQAHAPFGLADAIADYSDEDLEEQAA